MNIHFSRCVQWGKMRNIFKPAHASNLSDQVKELRPDS